MLVNTIACCAAGTINEVVLAAASPGEKDTPDIRKRMLESLEFQKEASLLLALPVGLPPQIFFSRCYARF